MFSNKTTLLLITTTVVVLFASIVSQKLCVSHEALGDEPTTLVAKSVAPALPDKVSFNAHIRPLMSNTCFTCHGPDAEDNESEYRIDSFEAATGKLPSDDDLVGIVPGDPMASEVYLRITGQGSGESMPPEDFRHHLSDYDKALFRKWIQQGAQYEQHWAYAPVQRASLPKLQIHANKMANEVDAFILARLESKGIDPAEKADKATLLRRLSLDLVGLPPTEDQLDEFVNDSSDDAYAKQVERLLASRHYGERMASGWLDAIRFADTVGFHGDQNLRNAPYRTYVIDSFNQNKPFDVFTKEQIAGDLLPNPTPQQLTATGALRLNMVTREGGAQPGEYLAKYKADRVRALGTAWLGSTLACCECHNHKYDPFSIKDFYSFGAFFDDLRQWGVYSNYGYTPNPDLAGFNNDYPFPPEMRIDSEPTKAEIRFLQNERDTKLLEELGDQSLQTAAFEQWATATKQTLAKHPSGWAVAKVDHVTTSGNTKHQLMTDDSVLLSGDGDASETIQLATTVDSPTLINAVRLEVLPDESHDGFIGRADDGRFALELTASVEDIQESEAPKVLNRPRFIRVELTGANKVLSLAEVEVFVKDDNGDQKNIAVKGKASQSTNYKTGPAELAIDGVTEGDYHQFKSVTHTSLKGSDPWWEVDLKDTHRIEKIVLWNRTDGNYLSRLDGCKVVLLGADREVLFVAKPATPKPSVVINVPNEVDKKTNHPIGFAWAEADRQDPPRYSSGQPPLTLKGKWQSGPERWQLPADENKMKHTAVYHFKQPLSLTSNQRLVFQITSGDVGRVRLSVTPLGHAIAGWDAASAELKQSLAKIQSNSTGSDALANLAAVDRARLASAFHRSTKPFDSQSPVARAYRDRILALHGGLAMTLVAQAVPADKVPVSRVLPRGNWLDKNGELAPPAFPEFLPAPKRQSDARLNRLDLADWIVHQDNPLTARHFVNRLWKQFFGAGLSGKLDDLGNQGEWPSHPLLLDWLASEFVQSGWDVKHMVRIIVNSRTYQQAAAVRDDLNEIDPYNRWLAQQQARRLPAEIIRDNALAIAGLLQTDLVGGSSVFPYQPAGYYSNLQFPNRTYQSTADGRQYRRGVYMHWQRTFLHPMLVNFDAPARDECTADRSLSNSPQQALTLLNDPQFVEAAVAMANRLISEQPSGLFDQLLDRAFRRSLARLPSDDERKHLHRLFRDQSNYYTENPDQIEKTLAADHRSTNRPADGAKHAAWSQVCRVILNLHETITRY